MIICRLLSKKWTSYLRLAFSVQPFPIGWKFQPKNENFRFVMKENVKFSNFEITPEIRELDPPILLWKLEFQLFLITYSNIIIMFLLGFWENSVWSRVEKYLPVGTFLFESNSQGATWIQKQVAWNRFWGIWMSN